MLHSIGRECTMISCVSALTSQWDNGTLQESTRYYWCIETSPGKLLASSQLILSSPIQSHKTCNKLVDSKCTVTWYSNLSLDVGSLLRIFLLKLNSDMYHKSIFVFPRHCLPLSSFTSIISFCHSALEVPSNLINTFPHPENFFPILPPPRPCRITS